MVQNRSNRRRWWLSPQRWQAAAVCLAVGSTLPHGDHSLGEEPRRIETRGWFWRGSSIWAVFCRGLVLV